MIDRSVMHGNMKAIRTMLECEYYSGVVVEYSDYFEATDLSRVLARVIANILSPGLHWAIVALPSRSNPNRETFSLFVGLTHAVVFERRGTGVVWRSGGPPLH